MKGVRRIMLLSVSTIAVLACQGCESAPVLSQHAPVTRYEVPQSGSLEARPAPLIATNSSFSLVQGQTNNTPQISISPVLGPTSIDIDFANAGELSPMRLSSSSAVVDFEGARAAANISNPVRSVRDFDAALAFSAGSEQTGLGFDVGLVPRISVKEDGDFEQRRFGGEIRIGQNFDQRGEDIESGSWYLFAGADGEALVYEPGDQRNFTNSMALRDQVTVGDMQAGISFSKAGGQLSLSYIRREVEYRERGVNGNETEDFAGVSFTLRR